MVFQSDPKARSVWLIMAIVPVEGGKMLGIHTLAMMLVFNEVKTLFLCDYCNEDSHYISESSTLVRIA